MSSWLITWWMPPFIHLLETFGYTPSSSSQHLVSIMIISRKPVVALWRLNGMHQAHSFHILQEARLWQGSKSVVTHASLPSTPAFKISGDIWQRISFPIRSNSQTNPDTIMQAARIYLILWHNPASITLPLYIVAVSWAPNMQVLKILVASYIILHVKSQGRLTASWSEGSKRL
jgi:hypothetical protein